MLRTLRLMVTSDDAMHKANNFLKLIKPPDETEMTDQNVKLDWRVDTGNRWDVADAKASMLAAGLDWDKRDTGLPLGEDNFRVVYGSTGLVTIPGQIPRPIEVTAGDPVTHFELLEEWMGPALAPGDPSALREGVSPVENPPGSVYDEWPSEATPDGVLNAQAWPTILVAPPLSNSPIWWRSIIQKIKDTSGSSNKTSMNGHGDSVWHQWTSTEDPDLGADQIWLFKENANGDPYPLRDRMKFAVGDAA